MIPPVGKFWHVVLLDICLGGYIKSLILELESAISQVNPTLWLSSTLKSIPTDSYLQHITPNAVCSHDSISHYHLLIITVRSLIIYEARSSLTPTSRQYAKLTGSLLLVRVTAPVVWTCDGFPRTWKCGRPLRQPVCACTQPQTYWPIAVQYAQIDKQVGGVNKLFHQQKQDQWSGYSLRHARTRE